MKSTIWRMKSTSYVFHAPFPGVRMCLLSVRLDEGGDLVSGVENAPADLAAPRECARSPAVVDGLLLNVEEVGHLLNGHVLALMHQPGDLAAG